MLVIEKSVYGAYGQYYTVAIQGTEIKVFFIENGDKVYESALEALVKKDINLSSICKCQLD